MPKITEKEFGKKMRWMVWSIMYDDYFIPLAFEPGSENTLIGINKNGEAVKWNQGSYWEEVEEHKKKVIKKMAPAAFKDKYGIFFIADQLFETKQQAETYLYKTYDCSNIKWPASESMWVEIEVEE